MGSPFTPIQAQAEQGSGLPAQSVQIDAELSRPPLSGRRQFQELVVTSHQLALAHAIEQFDPNLSGEMVVADPRSPKRLVWWAASGFPIRSGEPHQALQNFRDLDRCNAKVSVTTLSCASDEPRLLQFLQVAARWSRLSCIACRPARERAGQIPEQKLIAAATRTSTWFAVTYGRGHVQSRWKPLREPRPSFAP